MHALTNFISKFIFSLEFPYSWRIHRAREIIDEQRNAINTNYSADVFFFAAARLNN